MAVTPNGTKINFYNTDWATYKSKLGTAGAIKDGSLFFINDGSNGGGRIYNGSNLLANVGFEEFKFSTSGTGSFITGITPTAYISDDDKLTLELVGALGNASAAGNGTFQIQANGGTAVNTLYTANISSAKTGINFVQGTGVNVATTASSGTTPAKLTITHADASATAKNITSMGVGSIYNDSTTTAGTTSQTITYIRDVSLDDKNHVTGARTGKLTIQLPTVNNAALKIKSNSDTTGVQVFTANTNTASTFQIKGDATAEGESSKIYVKTTKTTANAPVLTISHATTGTAGNYGPSANVTATVGSQTSITIPYITTDSTGHVSASNKTLTFTIPDISSLSGAMHWKGSAGTSLPAATNYSPGDVITIDGSTKEYVLNTHNEWVEFGDEGSYLLKNKKIKADNTYITIGTGDSGTYDSEPTINHKALLATGTAGTAYGSTTAVPVIKVDAAGHVTSVSSSNIAFPTVTHPNGYGEISPENSPGVSSALTANTTSITAVSSNEKFKFKAANRWLTVAGSNSNTAGSDILQIAHTLKTSANDDIPLGETGQSSRTLSWGNSFKAVDVSIDSAGHITKQKNIVLTLPSNPNTHYTSKLIVTDASNSNTEASVSMGMGTVWLNHYEYNGSSPVGQYGKVGIKLVPSKLQGSSIVTEPCGGIEYNKDTDTINLRIDSSVYQRPVTGIEDRGSRSILLKSSNNRTVDNVEYDDNFSWNPATSTLTVPNISVTNNAWGCEPRWQTLT